MRHLLQLDPRLPPGLQIGDLLEKPQIFHHIAPRVEEQTIGRQPIAPRASGFLVVALDVFRQIGMDHVAHVRFVDPHAEGDGGANDLQVVAQKLFLVARPFLRLEPRMVRRRLDPRLAERRSHRLRHPPRLRVNNPRLIGPLPHELHHLRRSLGLWNNAVIQIRTIEAREKNFGIPQFQLRADVLPHPRGGRGGEGEKRESGETLAHLAQTPVFRTEVVTPFADAMRLVDRESLHPPLRQLGQKIRQHEPLRREIKEPVFAGIQLGKTLAGLGRIEGRIQKGRGHPAGRQLVDLILHQGDER